MGTKNTGIPSPGAFSNQDTSGTFTDNAVYGFPENGFVDKVWFYTANNAGQINLIYGVYRTDTGALIGSTGTIAAGSGTKTWRSSTFALTSGTNNYPGGYNSPYLYLWSGYGWTAGSWGSGAQNIAINTSSGGFYHLTGGSGPASSRANGGLNPFGNAGDLYYYLEYFPVATISSITSTPVAVGQNFTITGTSFTAGINSDGIKINGSAGTVVVTSYTINSDTQITCTVPAGATSGTVQANTNAGNPTSAGTLTISGGHVYRAAGGGWGAFPAYVARSGAWNVANGTYVARSGVWTPAQ